MTSPRETPRPTPETDPKFWNQNVPKETREAMNFLPTSNGKLQYREIVRNWRETCERLERQRDQKAEEAREWHEVAAMMVKELEDIHHRHLTNLPEPASRRIFFALQSKYPTNKTE